MTLSFDGLKHLLGLALHDDRFRAFVNGEASIPPEVIHVPNRDVFVFRPEGLTVWAVNGTITGFLITSHDRDTGSVLTSLHLSLVNNVGFGDTVEDVTAKMRSFAQKSEVHANRRTDWYDADDMRFAFAFNDGFLSTILVQRLNQDEKMDTAGSGHI